MHATVLPEGLRADGPHAGREEVEQHEPDRPADGREAPEDGPEQQRRDRLHDRRDEVSEEQERRRVGGGDAEQDRGHEHRQREDRDSGREDRAHVLVRCRRGRAARAAWGRDVVAFPGEQVEDRARRRGSAGPEEVRVPIDAVRTLIERGHRRELVVVDVAAAQEGPREERVGQHVG